MNEIINPPKTTSEIVIDIIELLEKNGIKCRFGIIRLPIGNRIIKYYTAIKELWQVPKKDIQECDLMRNLPKKLALFQESGFVSQVSELELLVILDELENK